MEPASCGQKLVDYGGGEEDFALELSDLREEAIPYHRHHHHPDPVCH